MNTPGTTPEQMEGWGWQIVHDPVSSAKSHGELDGVDRFRTIV